MSKYLVNTARSFIFSTALPPPAVAAGMAALELLREQPRRVEKLQRNAAVLRQALADEGLPAPSSRTQILPLVLGSAEDAMTASKRVLEQGVFAQAIRPPTVPDSSSRLRLTVMASHTKSELREAARSIAGAMPQAPRRPDESPTEELPAFSPARVFDGLADAA
jgi:glycine C-acetyltransferase/8-amino-7-oxononanoate synthase